MGEKWNEYRILVGKPEGNIPIGRPRCRWENNIKMGLRQILLGDVEWIDRAVMNTVMNLQFSQKVNS
jgi:hypothetical protein